MPIPAIPNAARIYKANKSGTLVLGKIMIYASGKKNTNSINIVLKTMRPLPYVLILLILKYSETRNLSVAEKSESTDFGNDNRLIKLKLLTIYFNKEGNDAGISLLNKLITGNVGEYSLEEKLTDGYFHSNGAHLLNYWTQNFPGCTKVYLFNI